MPLRIETVYSPIEVQQSKNKYIRLNLNKFRNLHYQTNNKLKKNYTEHMRDQIINLKPAKEISLVFMLYKGSKRKIDRSNILCIVEKFFCDALVKYGFIEDDNDDFIKSTEYRTNGIDRENPRVEIEIIVHSEH